MQSDQQRAPDCVGDQHGGSAEGQRFRRIAELSPQGLAVGDPREAAVQIDSQRDRVFAHPRLFVAQPFVIGEGAGHIGVTDPGQHPTGGGVVARGDQDVDIGIAPAARIVGVQPAGQPRSLQDHRIDPVLGQGPGDHGRMLVEGQAAGGRRQPAGNRTHGAPPVGPAGESAVGHGAAVTVASSRSRPAASSDHAAGRVRVQAGSVVSARTSFGSEARKR